MTFYPEDLFEKLEYNKVLALLEQYCAGSMGKEAARSLIPNSDKRWVDQRLDEVQEMVESLSGDHPFPQAVYENLDEDLRMLEVEGYVLPEDSLVRIGKSMQLVKGAFQFFSPQRQERFPTLYAKLKGFHFEGTLLEEIDRVVDEEGNIRPDASPQLQAIRQAIGSKQRELDKQFRQLANKYRSNGWLTDNVESLRNGRRVLSVPSEHKRKIRGIIHDESTTGKTAFIEPEAVIEINNDIFDLQTEEKREIYRILKELSALLRPYVPTIRDYQGLLVTYDLVTAKGRLAIRMDAQRPEVLSKPHLGWVKAFHPLLFLKNKDLGKATIPFDLQLFGPNRILILSGPNAGGKSITMKTVGVLQLMVQSGLLVPAGEQSKVGIFNKVFADIGDSQSIENDLSTYSSRLRNMKSFLDQADAESLVVIDEFGSGTDPKIGGSIAEAILYALNKKQVSGIITTHYSNLKVFAFKTKGILNGAMAFDKEHLTPTYTLSIGRPGSSYAFEIATKSGLDDAVLSYARKKTGPSEKAVDELLVDLQQQKKALEEKLESIGEREAKLDKLVKNYEQLHRDLEYKRKRLKLANKEQALQQQARENRELEKAIREIKEEKNLERARELARQQKEERERLAGKVQDLREEVYFGPKQKQEELQQGDHVVMISGDSRGVVESVNKGKAIIQMGMLRMTVAVRDLRKVDSPLQQPVSGKVMTDTENNPATFSHKIDIRGMRLDDALRLLEKFLDEALLSSATSLEIIHGKGTGVLRKAVRRKLKEYRVNMDVWHPEPQQGGDGVTLVEFQE